MLGLFLVMLLGLFLVMASWGMLLDAVRGLLNAVASLVVEHRLKGAQASVIVAPWALERELSSYGTGVSLFCGMWDLPRSGIEFLSPV